MSSRSRSRRRATRSATLRPKGLTPAWPKRGVTERVLGETAANQKLLEAEGVMRLRLEEANRAKKAAVEQARRPTDAVRPSSPNSFDRAMCNARLGTLGCRVERPRNMSRFPAKRALPVSGRSRAVRTVRQFLCHAHQGLEPNDGGYPSTA
jgi:hypothetical protein